MRQTSAVVVSASPWRGPIQQSTASPIGWRCWRCCRVQSGALRPSRVGRRISWPRSAFRNYETRIRESLMFYDEARNLRCVASRVNRGLS